MFFFIMVNVSTVFNYNFVKFALVLYKGHSDSLTHRCM